MLAYKAGGPCASVLTYSAKLIQPGRVEFVYKLPSSSMLLAVDVQNEQCQSYR